MTLRLVPTPLEVPIQPPAPRAGGVDPSLLDAFVPSATRDAELQRLRQPGALAVTTQLLSIFSSILAAKFRAEIAKKRVADGVLQVMVSWE